MALVFAVTGARVGWQLTQPTKKDLQILTNEAVLEVEPSLIPKLILAPAEIEVLHSIAQGFSNQEIADSLICFTQHGEVTLVKCFCETGCEKENPSGAKGKRLGLLK